MGSGRKGKGPVQLHSSGIASTQRMAYHEVDPFLEEFTEFLQSRAGGRRSDDAVAQM